MKTLSILILILTTFFLGCEKDSNTGKGYYDSMHFIRQGGGQIDFSLFATENSNKVNVVVSEYNFKDTTTQITIDSSSDNASAFSSFQKAINNQIQVSGNFQQSTLATGTWAYIYMVFNNEETEVTNPELRNSLLKFEQLVKDKIK